jgi:hypothetical protein
VLFAETRLINPGKEESLMKTVKVTRSLFKSEILGNG